MFGVPDARMGEEVAAWLKLNEGSKQISAEEIRIWCKEKVWDCKIMLKRNIFHSNRKQLEM